MAFTEFYCVNGGSNLNAGSTTSTTAALTSTNGNWSTTTNIFTPTDGSTPASFISVGDWVSIYNDGATVGVFIARVTAVAAGVNGGITVSASARVGTAPTTSATARSLKAGGAWQGPNGASGFPLGLAGWQSATNAASNTPRVNLKNDQTYSITTGISDPGSNGTLAVQGYSSSPGDGGRATIDGSTNAIVLFTFGTFKLIADIIFVSSATTGTNALLTINSPGATILRCVFHGARGNGANIANTNVTLIECEAYDCNKANTSDNGAFHGSSAPGAKFIRCIAHDNTGSNAHGFMMASGLSSFFNCISESNGGAGFKDNNTVPTDLLIMQCDFYNNGGAGISIVADFASGGGAHIENCNFIKNTGAGISNTGSTHRPGRLYNNGYGSGTQANGSADTLGDWEESGKVTYASGVTPWVDPANGDFRISLAAAISAGRGAFMQTSSGYAGAVGYPDIGAAQALVTAGGATSYSFG